MGRYFNPVSLERLRTEQCRFAKCCICREFKYRQKACVLADKQFVLAQFFEAKFRLGRQSLAGRTLHQDPNYLSVPLKCLRYSLVYWFDIFTVRTQSPPPNFYSLSVV
jgi:hypothetical protein